MFLYNQFIQHQNASKTVTEQQIKDFQKLQMDKIGKQI